ncbi:signal recognition particle subunit SRP72 [Geosmithia morbida]|uniref:Signal recognition particle subunit SRP72 n=1 Tax=Geosmithia morbida TaxID=1094350 RepID=A0A9P4YVJ3_9HYPO|nr:signal recognition particle subunit SRP72 [Geosmithia morbida]KAF4121784.1 signal recognition particle subunit SRP72 [Geosmithia morbida]
MPQDSAAALGALLRGVSIDDHEEVLKAANAALRSKKDDQTALHTRAVALLNLDRFDDALRAIDEGGDKLDAACRFEKAYALYKLGKLDDAAEVLKSIDAAAAADTSYRGHSHLAAQVAYRAERFDDAYAVYQRLLEKDPEAEDNDIKINMRAVVAQAGWLGGSAHDGDDAQDQVHQLDTFELCYNEACSCISRGILDQAELLLRRAETLCDASDDLTDEDRQAEMQPILAQKAYVQARLGKRQAESWTQRAKSAKLFSHQYDVVRRNGLIIDLQANKVRGVVDRTDKVISAAQHPSTQSDVNAISGLHAAASTHGKSGRELVRALQELTKKRPDNVGLALTLVQTYLDAGNQGAALSTLEAFLGRLERPVGTDEDEAPSPTPAHVTDARFSPGLVALVVSLMRSQGRHAAAKSELSKAARYWQDQDRPAMSSRALLQEAGIELLRSSNPRDLKLAGSAFEKLFSQSQGSHIASAGLVASLAPFDLAKANEHVGSLPEVDDLIADVDVGTLLDAGVATINPTTTAAGTKRSAEQDGRNRATPSAKRRRPNKLPKNYEEGKKLDPERWLPLRDRSSYRPKGKKGRKKAAESTQGGPVKDEETLGLVGGGGVKVEKAGGSGPGNNNSNKKKKKGKK